MLADVPDVAVVGEAGNGADAIVACGRLAPDIVLLDAMMPGLDGFGACRAMRAFPDGEHVPIVILTGLDDDESIARDQILTAALSAKGMLLFDQKINDAGVRF